MEGGHANIEIKTIIVITVTHEDAVGNEGSSDANSYKIERTKMLIIIMIAQLHIK